MMNKRQTLMAVESTALLFTFQLGALALYDRIACSRLDVNAASCSDDTRKAKGFLARSMAASIRKAFTQSLEVQHDGWFFHFYPGHQR